uniref:Uncharacterized protein n=1 Tax=Glossina pallidipes TaxID=7398 RepID=A0A1B0A691_GLOPL
MVTKYGDKHEQYHLPLLTGYSNVFSPISLIFLYDRNKDLPLFITYYYVIVAAVINIYRHIFMFIPLIHTVAPSSLPGLKPEAHMYVLAMNVLDVKNALPHAQFRFPEEISSCHIFPLTIECMQYSYNQ